jgi:hypothetical protein
MGQGMTLATRNLVDVAALGTNVLNLFESPLAFEVELPT